MLIRLYKPKWGEVRMRSLRFILTTFFFTGISVTAAANVATNTVTARLTKYHVKPNYQAEFLKAISDYVFSALKAEGNIMAEAYYELTDTTVLWIIERWNDKKQLDKHQGSNPAKAIITLGKQAMASAVETIYVNDLEPLGNNDWRRAPKAGDQPFTLMLFVSAKAGTQDSFTKKYHAAMPQFRNEPGVVTYQLCQVKGSPTKFITYEKFRNEAAFQYHLKHPAVQPIIEYLRSSITDPPFEKRLHRLIEVAPLSRE